MNFCSRSVLTCDSSLRCDEIMIPASVVHRLTRPVVVQQFNLDILNNAMRHGNILFIQRAGPGGRLRSVDSIASLDLPIDVERYSLIRHGNRYKLAGCPVRQTPCDIPLPIQAIPNTEVVLCFGDRLMVPGRGVVDPLQHVAWPEIKIGDTVLIVPQEGDWVLVNRQPTLVQESMLGMRIRIGPQLSFGATCAPVEALRPQPPPVNRWG